MSNRFERRPIRSRRRVLARKRRFGVFEAVEPRRLLAADPIITEFVSDNDGSFLDGDGDPSDWIEIHNQGDEGIDLNGWHLTDDAADLSKFTFPSLTIDAGEFIVVFASGLSDGGGIQPDYFDGAGNLHTNFRLSSSGEYLALVQPDGRSIASSFGPEYAEQHQGVAYGVDQSTEVVELIGEGRDARVLIPDADDDQRIGSTWTGVDVGFDDGQWQEVQLGVGFDDRDSTPGEDLNVAVDATVTASGPLWAGLNNPKLVADGDRGTFTHARNPVTSFHYDIDLGEMTRIDSINIVNRGDGCCPNRLTNYRVTVRNDNDGQIGAPVWSADIRTDGSNSGSAGVDVITRDFDPDGIFSGQWVRVEKIDDGSSDYFLQVAEVEVLASPGYGSLINSDIQAIMQDKNASAYLRVPFFVEDRDAIDVVTLGMSFDDGFVAYVNGTEVARRNAPVGLPPYSATSTDRHPDTGRATFNVPASALLQGDNVLAIHGLNHSANDDAFLIVPELEGRARAGNGVGYLLEPTPGTFNGEVVVGFVSDLGFDRERGFYDQAFDVQMSTGTPGATIVYTTDGSIPTLENGTQVTSGGVRSTASVRIESTATLRAAAFKQDLVSSDVETHSYLFLNDVIRQPASPDGLPNRWDGVAQAAIRADYQMDPEIVDDPAYSNDLLAGLREIPTMSIVLDSDDMFGDERGIYVNSGQRGRGWERPTSIEIMEPDGTTFQVDSGIRIHGFSWRFHSNTPKHSFRLEFRDEYGPAKLAYPLFPDSPVDRFDSIVLRAQGGRAWAGLQNPNQAQYLRDTFARDLSREMGRNDGHATLVHLYINGLYWGLYNPVERPDAQMGEEYFGGTQDDYDALNRRTSTVEVIDGDMQRYNEMLRVVNGALRRREMTDEEYAQLGQYVAMDEFIDFMIVNQYVTNRDGVSAFEGNNQRAIGSRVGDAQFRFYVWDMEYSLWNATDNNNVDRNRPALAGSNNPANGVWAIYRALRQHPEFRLRYADRVQHHFFNDGALTPESAAATWETRAESIENAIVAESARWGDAKRSRPYTRDREWQAERNRLLSSYFPRRSEILVGHLQDVGLYTETTVPQFLVNDQRQHGGKVEKGDAVSLKLVGELAGQERTFIAADSIVSAYVPTSDHLADSWQLSSFTEGGDGDVWTTGENGIGFDNAGEYNSKIKIDLWTEMRQNTSVFIRMPFAVDDPATLDAVGGLKLRMFADDGFVAYLNGTRVADMSAPEQLTWNSQATSGTEADFNAPIEFDISDFVDQLSVGENVLAIHGLNLDINSGDMLIQAELIAEAATTDQIWYTLDGSDPRLEGGQINNSANGGTAVLYDGSVALSGTSHIRTRALSFEGHWSAINDATFVVGTPIQITELNYNPADPSSDELAVLAGLTNGEFEFVEIQNTSDQLVSVAGARFTDGIEFEFPPMQLDAGERAVVVSDTEAFQLRYGQQPRILGEYSGRLADGGERLTLTDAVGDVLLDFQYNDSGLWPQAADGVGATLELLDLRATSAELSKYYSWRSSLEHGGTPGHAGAGPVGVVINEVLANTDAPGLVDFIELYNSSDVPIDVGGWYLSDSANQLLKYELPAETVLESGGYLVIDESQFNPTPNSPGENHFALSGANGDSVWLVTSVARDQVQSFVDDVHFGASNSGESFGRVPNGRGRIYPNTTRTPGNQNALPRVGPLVITEVNYHPGVPSPDALAIYEDLSENDLEFVELHNPTAQTVDLSRTRLRGGVDFDFANGVSIGAGQTIVIVNFDPNRPDNEARFNAFKTHYEIQDLTIVGGYDGRLSDGFDRVTVQTDISNAGDPQSAFVVEDEVIYDDVSPWPIQADGLGDSLHRTTVAGYGNDSSSWRSAVPDPGNVLFSPTPVGDFNGDLRVDNTDIDLLCTRVGEFDPVFDLNEDGVVTLSDHEFLIRSVLKTDFGDADLDGKFDSSDLVVVFQAGEYEDALANNSGWRDGDWNCDGEFDTSDLVDAFQAGGYLAAIGAVNAVSRPAVGLAAAHLRVGDPAHVTDTQRHALRRLAGWESSRGPIALDDSVVARPHDGPAPMRVHRSDVVDQIFDGDFHDTSLDSEDL